MVSVWPFGLRDTAASPSPRLHSLKGRSAAKAHLNTRAADTGAIPLPTACASFDQRKPSTVSKTPNLVQRPTGPTVYAPMKLPAMVNVPKTNDPALPSRIQQPAPQPKPVK
jgi:hypothetical protein